MEYVCYWSYWTSVEYLSKDTSMSFDIVDAVGKAVENQIPHKPQTARNILTAAYGWVLASGKLQRTRTYASAVERFNADIAKTIVSTFTKPENSVLINIFLPTEILAGMHVTPMFPEVISAYVANTRCCGVFADYAEGNNVPESFCSYHKTMIGMAEAGVLPAPRLIANTTLACDANQVSFRRLAHHFAIPQYVVDVPHTPTNRAVDQVELQLYELIATMENSFGRPFDTDAFMEALITSNETIEIMKEYRAHRSEVVLPTSTTGELLEMMAMHLMLGQPSAKRYAKDLLDVAKRAPGRTSSDKPRIFWMHTLPNWQLAMRDLFDGPDAHAELVGNDMTYDASTEIDLANPVRSLARRIVYNHFNGSGKRRIETTLTQAKAADADGIIVFCHWGCKQTLGISQLAKTTFEAQGLPTLVLDGDGCDPRNVADGQMITRVNAFIEQLGGMSRG